MTLPVERTQAVLHTEKFLQNLSTNTKMYPGVPKIVREQARMLLRHYPSAHDVKLTVAGYNDRVVSFTVQCPFGDPDEKF